jgi:hypothetical protein
MPPYATGQIFHTDEEETPLVEPCDAATCSPKSVGINLDRNEVVEIPHYTEFSQDDKEKLWVTKDESLLIKNELTESVAKLDGRRRFDEISDTTTGLAYFTYQAAIRRQCRRLRLQRSIFEEQERQRQAGEIDLDVLAHIAATCVLTDDDASSSESEADENDYVSDYYYDNDGEDAIIPAAMMLCCWQYGILSFLKYWK